MKKLIAIIVLTLLLASCSSGNFKSSEISIRDLYESSEPISIGFDSSYSDSNGMYSTPGRLAISSEHSMFSIDYVNLNLHFAFGENADYIGHIREYLIELKKDGETFFSKNTDASDCDVADFTYKKEDGKYVFEHSENFVFPPEYFSLGNGEVTVTVIARRGSSGNKIDASLSSGSLYYYSDGESVMLSESPLNFGLWSMPLGQNEKNELIEKCSIQLKNTPSLITRKIISFDVIAFDDSYPFSMVDENRVVICATHGRRIEFYLFDGCGDRYLDINEKHLATLTLDYCGKITVVADGESVLIYLWEESIVFRVSVNQNMNELYVTSAARILNVKENYGVYEELDKKALAAKVIGNDEYIVDGNCVKLK